MVIKLKSKKQSLALNYLLDAVLLFIAFTMAYYAKRRDLVIEDAFLNLLPYYYFAWFFASFISRKFKPVENEQLVLRLKPYILSILFMVGIISIFLYGFKLFNLSRFVVWGSLGIFLVLELFLLSGSYFFPRLFNGQVFSKSIHSSFIFFALEFTSLTAVFLSLYFYKRGTIDLSDPYIIILMGIYLTWIYVSLVTHKFVIPQSKNYLKVIWPFVKSALFILGIVSFFIFTFRILEYSRLFIFGGILGFAILEFIIVTVYYIYSRPRISDEVQPHLFKAELLFEPEPIEKIVEERQRIKDKYKIPVNDIQSDILKDKLQSVYLKDKPELYNFLDNTINLNIDIRNSEIISSGNPYNIQILPDETLHFLVNLHEVNDFRRINKYFIDVNKRLVNGGVFISRFIPLENRRQHFLSNYPRNLSDILYLFDFVWKRIFPKLPFFQKIYFGLTQGRKRVLSKAEALGRLYYCGFEIISLKAIDDYIYFIAKKEKEPLKDASPSYSPLFKMRRSGKLGNDIFVYKFRTMYPYSEYLQSYLVEVNGYAENGKIKNDFRITTWGNLLRKYWLDEAPQLINLLKGEMSLVGIRPISERFLKEFPDDIRKLRMKYKPGCIPAYVSLLKQSKDGFIEAETTYLLEKEKHALITDVKYIYLGIFNIFTNKIRSA